MNTKVAAIALAAAATAVVLAFLLLPGPETPVIPEETPTSTPPGSSSPSQPFVDRASDEETPVTRWAQTAPQGAAMATQNEEAWEEWENRLDELLTNDADNATTVRELVSSMRGLPAEAQEEFVAHAVNLCEDDQFGVLEEIYYNSATPAEVSETIFNDALNRPDEIKLPMLAKTLRNPTHPMAGEAQEILEMYLDLDPGMPPAQGWEQAVNDYIREEGQP